MQLSSLKLENFRGAKSLTVLCPEGHNLAISGQNGAGKTTIADAITWLWTGKDSQGHVDFDWKPQDPLTSEDLHNLATSVEATYLLETEQVLTLKREITEVWKQKERGVKVNKLDTHVTRYWFNGVPLERESDWSNRLAGICTADRFRLLADPSYFAFTMPWKDRRRELLQICGDVTQSEVLDANASLSPLREPLGQHSLDDLRAIKDSARKAINRELDQIPALIGENKRSLKDADPDQAEAIANAVTTLESEVNRLREQRAQAAAGGAVAQATLDLTKVEAQMLDFASKLKTHGNPARDQALKEQGELTTRIGEVTAELDRIKRGKANDETDLNSLTARLKNLREDFTRIRDKEAPSEEICPSCKQPLPAERAQEAKEQFNQAKASDLEGINAQIRPIKERVATLGQQIEDAGQTIPRLEEQIRGLTEQRDAVMIPEIGEAPDPSRFPDYQVLVKRKEDIQAKIVSLKADSQGELNRIDQEIAETHGRYREAVAAQEALKQNEQLQTRITELEARQKELGAQMEETEQILALLDEFVRTKVKLLTGKINANFKVTRWKLFEPQMNGGIAECCEATFNGLPPSHGQEILVGLDCINVLGEHFGFTPPVLIDNSEALTVPFETKAQQIHLVASKSDRELRFETTPALREEQGTLV